jgi:hypothetical protein
VAHGSVVPCDQVRVPTWVASQRNSCIKVRTISERLGPPIVERIVRESAAGLLGTALRDAKEYGWQLDASKVTHDWNVLRDAVQDYIRGTNWGYRSALRVRRVGFVSS